MVPESTGLCRLDQQLEHWAATRPDHPAIVGAEGALTFRQLHSRAKELAAQLAHLGLRSRDVVAFQLPNLRDAFALFYAIGSMDAVALPILPAMREHDLSYMLREAQAVIFVTVRSWRGVDHEALAKKCCSESVSIALLDGADGLSLMRDGFRPKNGPERPPLAEGASVLDAVSSIIFTSGTSGRAKGVVYSHRSLAVEGREMVGLDGIRGEDVLFVPPSIAHISGISFAVCTSMAAGCTVCLLAEWNAEAAVRTIEREGCTWTAGATPFLQGIVDAAERNASSVKRLRVFRCGGASVPPALVRRARELGIDAYRSYGMSEHPTISGRAGQPEHDCLHTDGIVHPHVEMIIVDPADAARRMPRGEAGEIAVRGPDQAVGYLRAEDTLASRHGDWLLTGDIGRISEGGAVTITGRKKDIIIRKGENIAAKELEDLISEIPQVKDVAVVGIPDAERGEMVCCVAVVKPGYELSLASLCAHLRQAGVSTFKLPERFECVEALPYNSGGKVLKSQLRKMLAP
jgi:cyclohexanecarboxylate-CoA ligase